MSAGVAAASAVGRPVDVPASRRRTRSAVAAFRGRFSGGMAKSNDLPNAGAMLKGATMMRAAIILNRHQGVSRSQSNRGGARHRKGATSSGMRKLTEGDITLYPMAMIGYPPVHAADRTGRSGTNRLSRHRPRQRPQENLSRAAGLAGFHRIDDRRQATGGCGNLRLLPNAQLMASGGNWKKGDFHMF